MPTPEPDPHPRGIDSNGSIRDHATEFFEEAEALAIEDSIWWACGRRSIIRLFMDRAKTKNVENILEIGCGSGGDLELLSRYGRVWGLEHLRFWRRAPAVAALRLPWLNRTCSTARSIRASTCSVFSTYSNTWKMTAGSSRGSRKKGIAIICCCYRCRRVSFSLAGTTSCSITIDVFSSAP